MINCREIAYEIKRELKQKLTTIKRDVPPRLAIIQVGDNSASNNYVKGKIKDCEEIGITTSLFKLHEDITEEEVIDLIESLNDNEYVHGIIVQLPLPPHLNEERITKYVAANKDVDGFVPGSPFTPCTPLGVLTLLDKLGVDVDGKLVTLVGYGKLVNKPLMQLLSDKGATVCVCRSHTPQRTLEFLCKFSDIIVSATGKHGIIDTYCVVGVLTNAAPIVIDCGIQVIDGKQYGDCAEEVYDLIDKVTPRVGGMGLMTRVGLLQNVIEAYEKWN